MIIIMPNLLYWAGLRSVFQSVKIQKKPLVPLLELVDHRIDGSCSYLKSKAPGDFQDGCRSPKDD